MSVQCKMLPPLIIGYSEVFVSVLTQTSTNTHVKDWTSFEYERPANFSVEVQVTLGPLHKMRSDESQSGVHKRNSELLDSRYRVLAEVPVRSSLNRWLFDIRNHSGLNRILS